MTLLHDKYFGHFGANNLARERASKVSPGGFSVRRQGMAWCEGCHSCKPINGKSRKGWRCCDCKPAKSGK